MTNITRNRSSSVYVTGHAAPCLCLRRSSHQSKGLFNHQLPNSLVMAVVMSSSRPPLLHSPSSSLRHCCRRSSSLLKPAWLYRLNIVACGCCCSRAQHAISACPVSLHATLSVQHAMRTRILKSLLTRHISLVGKREQAAGVIVYCRGAAYVGAPEPTGME